MLHGIPHPFPCRIDFRQVTNEDKIRTILAMKIDRVIVEPYRIRMTRPIGDANFPEGRHTVGGSIVTVETDDGHSGLALGASGIGGRLRSRLDRFMRSAIWMLL